MKDNTAVVEEVLNDMIENGDLEVTDLSGTGNGKFVGGLAVGVAAGVLFNFAYKKVKGILAKKKAEADDQIEADEADDSDEE